MNKKQLYEAIMFSVAKEVKKALNEGAWGYDPSQSDDYLDECAVVGRKILSLITNNFEKAIKKNDCQKMWDYMGIVIDFLRTKDLSGENLFWDDKAELHYTVNPGEKNEEQRIKYGVKLNQLFNQAYEILNTPDNSFAKDWREPEKFKRYLDGLKTQFSKMMLERKTTQFGNESWQDDLRNIEDARDKSFYKYDEK